MTRYDLHSRSTKELLSAQDYSHVAAGVGLWPTSVKDQAYDVATTSRDDSQSDENLHSTTNRSCSYLTTNN